ncbi:hypothetical protein [Massilia sp. TS11]|uniref:hypothetical protein n=1 Tax=Massilia sp. TS11 TaxID=2908003 RepID=UPI001EDA08CD|nr:hypothetical protein [Massilia sp. TS11]MCG2586724.1 hypothetical protein [Massilia sp. TS11]
MKAIIKNMEAIFLAIAALTCVTTYASAEIPKFKARQAAKLAAAHTVDLSKDMQVVVVSAKRLSAAEKAALN